MKIAIVDDTPSDLETTRKTIAEAFHRLGVKIEKTECFDDSRLFAESFVRNSYDIIFMDIIMDAMDGIAAASLVRRRDNSVKLVFCSTSNEYAFESYKVSADYYLIKPLDEHFDALMKCLDCLHILTDENEIIRLPDGTSAAVSGIISTEYYNHIIDIHLKDGRTLRQRMRQTDLEELLAGHSCFLKCSKGCMVNMNEIISFSKDEITMKDGTVITVSRRRVKEAEQCYAEFMFEKLRREVNV